MAWLPRTFLMDDDAAIQELSRRINSMTGRWQIERLKFSAIRRAESRPRIEDMYKKLDEIAVASGRGSQWALWPVKYFYTSSSLYLFRRLDYEIEMQKDWRADNPNKPSKPPKPD